MSYFQPLLVFLYPDRKVPIIEFESPRANFVGIYWLILGKLDMTAFGTKTIWKHPQELELDT